MAAVYSESRVIGEIGRLGMRIVRGWTLGGWNGVCEFSSHVGDTGMNI